MVINPASTLVLPFARAESTGSAPLKVAPTAAATGSRRVGIVCNPRAHLNRGAEYEAGVPGAGSVLVAAPRTRAALADKLAEFAARGVDLLVIDGGDGTVRDVLSCAGDAWTGHWPQIVVIPSGKTNALALDLGLPQGWTLEDALAALDRGRTVRRRPVEITREEDSARLRGFLFGAGAFVGATELAQHTHRAGAFNGVAVGLALGWAVLQTMFGPETRGWRAGTPMRLGLAGQDSESRARYLLLASTLDRLPLGVKPFGPARRGLKLLAIDAPPRRILAATPAILAGADAPWLEAAGYHRLETTGFDVTLDQGFILDGEHYPGGALSVRLGPPLSFVVP